MNAQTRLHSGKYGHGYKAVIILSDDAHAET